MARRSSRNTPKRKIAPRTRRSRAPVTSEAPVAAAPEAALSTNGGPRPLEIPRALSVKDLGELMDTSPVEVIKELMKNGVMASINQVIDFDTAAIVAHDMGFEPKEAAPQEIAEQVLEQAPVLPRVIEEDDPAKLQPRPPVVTVMGHVDHGKTSILDAIRKTSVAAGEVGGITQHIGAYQVEVDGHPVTFVDTPGHEAFTAMRARGAQCTDIAVLVVAADDGVMPQTVEALNHARAAGVPIVVAINKSDLESANPDRVKQQLAEQSLTVEDWGGDTVCVPVSARTGDGLKELLDSITVVAELQELKANPDRPAVGFVLEAELDKSRGVMATVLVHTGTLRQGDVVLVGDTWGKVKAMFDFAGKRLKEAGPSMPVQIMGLADMPAAGDTLAVAADERTARALIEHKRREAEELAAREQRAITLETLFGELAAGKVKELNVILKTDVQGSIEPIRTSLERLSTDEVKVHVIHTASGTVTESDVMLAAASKAIIIGFHTRPEPGAKRLAESEGVDVRYYQVIYEVVEDVEKALVGLLEPVTIEVVDGHAEVRQVFKLRRSAVAGSYVREGTVSRNSFARVVRDGQIIADTRVDSLRRFKDDVREVQQGFECGITLADFMDYNEGDVIEFYHKETGRPELRPRRPAAAARPSGAGATA